ncbi:TPA: hypothetical protein DEP90_02980 [Patescibacteria group bacterium]|nr:hypothetical protein [Patescibacteria group bacterium]
MESIGDIIKKLQRKVSDDNKKNTQEKDQEELFDTASLTSPKYISGRKKGYITKEYQSYGAWLSRQLNDPKRISMYIKWAKDKPRGILENAYRFTVDYPKAKNKSRIFMWKVKELEGDKVKKYA